MWKFCILHHIGKILIEIYDGFLVQLKNKWNFPDSYNTWKVTHFDYLFIIKDKNQAGLESILINRKTAVGITPSERFEKWKVESEQNLLTTIIWIMSWNSTKGQLFFLEKISW